MKLFCQVALEMPNAFVGAVVEKIEDIDRKKGIEVEK
jgi:hypothetical protein